MASLETRVRVLEQELDEIKKQLLRGRTSKKRVSLKGAFRGVRFEKKDVRAAKRSLFPAGRDK